MKANQPLPNRLQFRAISLPAIQIKDQGHGRLIRVQNKGDWEFDTDPHGRYAYNLVAAYSYLYQWRIGDNGLLHPLSPHKVPAHSHPNTLQFHPNGRFAYVTCSHGAICQYHVQAGVLIPMKPLEVYAVNNPSSLWFDRTGNYVCVMTPGVEDGSPPNDRLYIYRVVKAGRLELAHQIEMRSSRNKISHDALAGEISSFTVSGDNLRR